MHSYKCSQPRCIKLCRLIFGFKTLRKAYDSPKTGQFGVALAPESTLSEIALELWVIALELWIIALELHFRFLLVCPPLCPESVRISSFRDSGLKLWLKLRIFMSSHCPRLPVQWRIPGQPRFWQAYSFQLQEKPQSNPGIAK